MNHCTRYILVDRATELRRTAADEDVVDWSTRVGGPYDGLLEAHERGREHNALGGACVIVAVDWNDEDNGWVRVIDVYNVEE